MVVSDVWFTSNLLGSFGPWLNLVCVVIMKYLISCNWE